MGEDSALLDAIISFCDITTIALCVICKIPQIWTIFKTKSVEGLSTHSLVLELLTYLISLCYNVMRGYPLLSFMEDPFLVVQSLIVLLMVYYYLGNLDVQKLGMVGGGAVLFYAITLGYPHPAILPLLLTATLPMKVSSKLLQIKEIWVLKKAGSISLVSYAINIYTCCTRILTTALVTGDMTLLIKHSLSASLNVIVIGSALLFTPKKEKEL